MGQNVIPRLTWIQLKHRRQHILASAQAIRPATHVVRRARPLRIEAVEGGVGADGPHSIAPVEVAMRKHLHYQPIAIETWETRGDEAGTHT